VSELQREHLPQSWTDRRLEALARLTRPWRRRLAPGRFKETYVNRALARFERPRVYVEIGVREGESFRHANADQKVGIDPELRPSMAALRPGERFMQMTSDDFFAGADGVLTPQTVHVALVDGLHEFRQALRDVLNLEPYMHPKGVVLLDDCNPRSAERASEEPIPGAWNGDVWKVPACLRVERPDLIVATLDADEGVGVVAGFGGGGRMLDEGTVQRYKSLGYGHLANNRRAVLNLIPASQFESLLP
jgi:hypothetical protein